MFEFLIKFEKDVPYDLYSSFNHVPVLPFNPAIQFINKPSSQV